MFLKSKKTATEINKAISASPAPYRGRAGVLLLIMLVATGSLFACDMSAFTQSEFAERCQLLLNLCEKANLARNLGHPDSKIYNGALSREWVRFFLAHGNHASIPPSLSFVASDSWSIGMNEIGLAITREVSNGIDEKEFNRLRLRILLIKEPQRIEKLHGIFAGRQRFIAKNDDNTDRKNWLEKALLLPASAILEQLNENPELQDQLQYEIESYLSSFDRVLEYEKEGCEEEILAALFTNLQQEINLDMLFWEALFFYST